LLRSDKEITDERVFTEKNDQNYGYSAISNTLPNSSLVTSRALSESTSKRKIWVEAYGCPSNIADSEIIKGLLTADGFDMAVDQKEADASIIVTCSVKDSTEHRMIHRINEITKSRRPIVVAGCLAKADRSKVESVNLSASLIGPNSIDQTVQVVRSALNSEKMVVLEDSVFSKLNIPRIRLNRIISIVEISTGCLSECTFCQTKLARGWLKSYRVGEITRQISGDISEGCKEIWLSSTDNGCYGRDIGVDLVHLLNSCVEIDANFMIRIGMMNPMYIPSMEEELVKVFEQSKKIFKFIHIPVQSGSDRILKMMKRGHTVDVFRKIVKMLRNEIPEITIATDIIVGFPSETEADFQDTLSLISEVRPDVVNISKYSSRPGTRASKRNKIDSQLVKRRTERLHLLVKKICYEQNLFWKNWIGKILVDEVTKDAVVGRNYAYKPIFIPFTECGLSKESANNILGAELLVGVRSVSANALCGSLLQ
jgi:threonylcarbamoyladenosine tRNA methylthiotransferase CDKAL1